MNLIESLEDERISKIEAEWNSALNGQKEETRLVAQVVTYLLKCLRASLQKLHDLKGDGPWIAYDARIKALTERAEAAEAQLCAAREENEKVNDRLARSRYAHDTAVARLVEENECLHEHSSRLEKEINNLKDTRFELAKKLCQEGEYMLDTHKTRTKERE